MATTPIKGPLQHTAVGMWRTLLTDADGNEVGDITGALFVFELWDARDGTKVGVYGTWGDAWRAAIGHFGVPA